MEFEGLTDTRYIQVTVIHGFSQRSFVSIYDVIMYRPSLCISSEWLHCESTCPHPVPWYLPVLICTTVCQIVSDI